MSVLYRPTLTQTQRRALDIRKKLLLATPPPPKTREEMLEVLQVRYRGGRPEALFPGHPEINDRYRRWGPRRLFPGHPDVREPVTIEVIQRAVCREFTVNLAQVLSKRKYRHIVDPRRVAVYLAIVLTRQPLLVIGREFGRDHTFVIHARDVIKWKIGIRPNPPPPSLRKLAHLLAAPVDEVLRKKVEKIMQDLMAR